MKKAFKQDLHVSLPVQEQDLLLIASTSDVGAGTKTSLAWSEHWPRNCRAHLPGKIMYMSKFIISVYKTRVIFKIEIIRVLN